MDQASDREKRMTDNESTKDGGERPRGEPPERLGPKEGTFPAGVVQSSHAFGPYLYRSDEVVVVAESDEELAHELERFGRWMANPALQRRMFWDIVMFRFFGE